MSPSDDTRARNRLAALRYRARLRRADPPLRRPGQSDRWAKPYRVLTEDQVAEIRRRAEAGESHRSLAEAFTVDPSHVSRIVRNQRRRGEQA